MKNLTIIASLVFIPLLSFSQKNGNSELFESRKTGIFNLSSHMEIGVPLGDFNDKIERNTLWGKGFYLMFRSESKPIDFGFRIGDLVYDVVRRSVNGSTIQKSKNKIWMWYGAFRYEPNIKLPVYPYFEGSFGINRFHSKAFSREKGIVLFDDQLFNPHFDKIRLNSDWAVGYGGAIGFYWVLEDSYYPAIDVQIGYQTRGLGTFLIKENLDGIQENPIDNFSERTSKMELISIKIGISIMGHNE